ncbi:T9SS type A sorting domain-containing protein [Larkinella sp. VNQ87]|uniref:T9SS type A sorting domain-containing protein n=1 Tax=Larkinella sp. VNQ87 TaxID=3400921 RepID=UPI003C0931FB
MKTLVNTLFVAFVLTFASFTVSNADIHKPAGRPKKVAAFQTGMYPTTSGKLQIMVEKQAGGPVEVRLTNPAGDVLFVQKVGKRQQSVRLSLDVRNLPDGVYQVAITNGDETKTQNVSLSTQQPSAPIRSVVLK